MFVMAEGFGRGKILTPEAPRFLVMSKADLLLELFELGCLETDVLDDFGVDTWDIFLAASFCCNVGWLLLESTGVMIKLGLSAVTLIISDLLVLDDFLNVGRS